MKTVDAHLDDIHTDHLYARQRTRNMLKHHIEDLIMGLKSYLKSLEDPNNNMRTSAHLGQTASQIVLLQGRLMEIEESIYQIDHVRSMSKKINKEA